MQALAATHETAAKPALYLTAGSVIRRQLVPFQTIPAEVSPEEPTARQKRLDTHETPDSGVPRTDPSGVERTVQAVPFQISTIGRALVPPRNPPTDWRPFVWVAPTATQNVAETHDTEASTGLGPAAGVGRTTHDEPSHRSANVAIGPSRSIPRWSNPKSEVPTTMQNVADGHDTLMSAAFGDPLV